LEIRETISVGLFVLLYSIITGSYSQQGMVTSGISQWTWVVGLGRTITLHLSGELVLERIASGDYGSLSFMQENKPMDIVRMFFCFTFIHI
jgi:hypothetical protein